jgi:RNA polymerase sigma-70 factor (ECF subfamily)
MRRPLAWPGLYTGWQTDYTRQVKMTATPLQNQSAQVQGAESPSPLDGVPVVDADQEVIARVLAGHKDAFGILITRYSDPLYRHALGMTGSPDVAEDILQASFIKAFQHLGEVRGRFDAWVFRIVANSCKDWLKNIRRTHVSYDEDDQPSTYSTPEEEMDRNELRTDLEYALARLAPSLREAFVMKHVEGRSYEEMALLLETTVGALKMRVHRAREALQQLLEEKYS